MLPLSFQGFGFTGILLLVAILSLAQLGRYLKERKAKKNDHSWKTR
jgi:hypothetical protein